MHDPEGHPDWREDLGFSFYDRASEVCGLMRMRFRPKEKIKEMVCSLTMPDGSVVWLKDDSSPYDSTLEARKLKFLTVEPDRRWMLAFAGGMVRTTERKERKSHVEFDLEFIGLNEVFNHGGPSDEQENAPRIPQLVGLREQFGRVRGRLSTGLEEYDVNALGAYRNSWRLRDDGSVSAWTWMSCQFSETHAFALSRLAAGNEQRDSGFFFIGGKNLEIAEATLAIRSDTSGDPRLFDVGITDREGAGHKVIASTIRRVGVPLGDVRARGDPAMHEVLARYNLGGSVGYGLVEHLLAGR